jgi:hypothetical protein
MYDPVTNTFAPAASLPTMNAARQCATATLLLDGQVLIAGGFGKDDFFGGDSPLASVELYDPPSNTFAPAGWLPDMNAARIGATATLTPEGEVLIAGGLADGSGSLTNVDVYDPTTDSFAAPASTPNMNEAQCRTLRPGHQQLCPGGIDSHDEPGTLGCHRHVLAEWQSTHRRRYWTLPEDSDGSGAQQCGAIHAIAIAVVFKYRQSFRAA